MNRPGQNGAIPPSILMAEDDPDDRFIIQLAFRELRVTADLRLMLLDLNMPHKDGREALREIKSDAHLRKIPVVIWTTSNLPKDGDRCSGAGAEGYLTKPAGYAALLETVRRLCRQYLPESC